jgi:hypothetical protein
VGGGQNAQLNKNEGMRTFYKQVLHELGVGVVYFNVPKNLNLKVLILTVTDLKSLREVTIMLFYIFLNDTSLRVAQTN